MQFLIVAICLVAVSASQAKVLHHPMETLMDLRNKSGFDSRIISGQNAAKGQIPWQAGLTITKAQGAFICGGSLIDEEWILTAAHCVENAKYVEVQLGVTKFNIDMTEKIISRDTQVHEGYNAWLHNDVGLIKLPHKVAVTDTVKPIRLPSRSEGSDPLVNVKVTASGFGATSNNGGASSILNFVELTTISNNDCAKVYGSSIISSSICAVGNPQHSTCSGDSGGPLVLHRDGKEPTLIGVVSFVHIAGCDSGNPSGYGRVTGFLDWIHEKTGIAIQD